MEWPLDTRLHSTKLLISSASESSEEEDEDELEKRMALPGKPGCYEEQLLMMIMLEKGRTSAARPGSAAQSHPHFLTLFLSPTTSPSSSCHHQQYHPSNLLENHHNSIAHLSKTCIPNKRSTPHGIRHSPRSTHQIMLMTSFH